MSNDKKVIRAALQEAIAKREEEIQQLVEQIRVIEKDEVEQQIWIERKMRESGGA